MFVSLTFRLLELLLLLLRWLLRRRLLLLRLLLRLLLLLLLPLLLGEEAQAVGGAGRERWCSLRQIPGSGGGEVCEKMAVRPPPSRVRESGI